MPDEYSDVLERAMAWASENHPNASSQKKAAFANSVAYAVTGASGGYGGPSVREHAACRIVHQAIGDKRPFITGRQITPQMVGEMLRNAEVVVGEPDASRGFMTYENAIELL